MLKIETLSSIRCYYALSELKDIIVPLPRALPWAFLCKPFGLLPKIETSPLNSMTLLQAGEKGVVKKCTKKDIFTQYYEPLRTKIPGKLRTTTSFSYKKPLIYQLKMC